MPIESLDLTIKILGSQDNLAAALGIKSPSITGWKDRKRVPAERCLAIEAVTRGAVTRHDLRPDVFGEAPAKQQQVSA
jgi:DNA-binding transcriptional regulator YdaS (Cro superfamily)